MSEINYAGIAEFTVIGVLLIALLVGFTVSSGCVTLAKNTARDIMATPTPTPTPEPTPVPTTQPTPTPIPTVPTLAAHFVDPYMPGERWEGQWYKWMRVDVQGINGEGMKDLNVGIIVYRHKFMDKYTWYNGALGQYMVQTPPGGMRYFVVWVHEEMFGENKTYDPRFWILDENAFRIQAGDQMINTYADIHNPVNRIKEFDQYYDYYNSVVAGPFGYQIRYTGNNPETAGYAAEPLGWLRWGKGNAVDGYIIYEVPEETKEEEILLLGGFSTFGNAYWRFTT